MIRQILIFLVIAASASCSSTRAVSHRYQAQSNINDSEETAILFLIDGLSVELTKKAIARNHLQNTAAYFGFPKNEPSFLLARAGFPSLTYPNIASMLTGSPIGHHPILGNRILRSDGQLLNFEDIRSWSELNQLLEDQTVFTKLGQKGLGSISFSYPFKKGTTAYQSKTVDMGLRYAEGDFAAIDRLTLASVHRFLQTTPEERWPRFIFVHLIGVDGYAHSKGPDNEILMSYINELDQMLAPIYQKLKSTGAKVIRAALTSDHGFAKSKKTIPLDQVFQKLGYNLQLVNDNRMAFLNFQKNTAQSTRQELAQALLLVPGVEWSVLSSKNHLELFRSNGERAHIEFLKMDCNTHGLGARFRWVHPVQNQEQNFQCIEAFDQSAALDNLNFMVSSLVPYFNAPQAPDMIVLPKDDFDFVGGYSGNHGGLTKEEIFVPLFTHNLPEITGIHGTWKLLYQMGVLQK